MNQALGVIEVMGTVPASVCIDTMGKTAYITVRKVEQIGSGLVTIMIEGDVASVDIALEAGAEQAARYGEVVGTRTIAKPSKNLTSLFANEIENEAADKEAGE